MNWVGGPFTVNREFIPASLTEASPRPAAAAPSARCGAASPSDVPLPMFPFRCHAWLPHSSAASPTDAASLVASCRQKPAFTSYLVRFLQDRVLSSSSIHFVQNVVPATISRPYRDVPDPRFGL